jgi:hypothetical protein
VTITKNVTALLILILVIGFYFLPEKYFASSLTDKSYCLHKQLFGFGCPGCGLTRACYYFIHLNFLKAIHLNASVLFVFPVAVGEITYRYKKNKIKNKIRFYLYLCFCISLLILYITRIINHLN